MVRMNSRRTIRPKRIDLSQEAETAVPECEQIDEEGEQNQGQPESCIPSKHLENGVGSDFGAPFGHRYVFGLFSNNVGAFSFPMKPTL